MRYFFEIQYNGSQYHGWQFQPNALTVQEVIETNLSKVFRQKTAIVGCGRTDTGVHASQYFFHCDADSDLNEDFAFKMNGMFPKDISITKIHPVNDKAHARFDATKREYTYKMCLHKSPFEVNRSWILPYYQLDIEAMQQAANDIKKYNDFPNLCKAGSDVKNHICQIFNSELIFIENENRLVYQIAANRFLRNMIRRIVGLFIQIGKKQLSLTDFNACLSTKQPFKYITLAPPEGLYLSKIEYPFIK